METNEIVFELEGTVLFSPAQRCLNGPNGSVVILTENNLRFLQLLLEGVTEKELIINQVWKEQRGAISESSYYGQLYMLRKAFIQVGLNESLIHTIPRKGVRYTGSVSQVMTSKGQEKQSKIDDNHEVIAPPALSHIATLAVPTHSAISPVAPVHIKQSFLQSNRWKKLISLLAFFSFCWLSFLSALVIIILLDRSK
ncbi:transcriptional regulator [Yersinia sp. HM-2024]|uniref:winged helix-turn-helix domain-containing protein n=1 Tax=Yersinia sp. HM-2024 TaxID=3344550 RepID=UPI00370CFE2D